MHLAQMMLIIKNFSKVLFCSSIYCIGGLFRPCHIIIMRGLECDIPISLHVRSFSANIFGVYLQYISFVDASVM